MASVHVVLDVCDDGGIKFDIKVERIVVNESEEENGQSKVKAHVSPNIFDLTAIHDKGVDQKYDNAPDVSDAVEEDSKLYVRLLPLEDGSVSLVLSFHDYETTAPGEPWQDNMGEDESILSGGDLVEELAEKPEEEEVEDDIKQTNSDQDQEKDAPQVSDNEADVAARNFIPFSYSIKRKREKTPEPVKPKRKPTPGYASNLASQLPRRLAILPKRKLGEIPKTQERILREKAWQERRNAELKAKKEAEALKKANYEFEMKARMEERKAAEEARKYRWHRNEKIRASMRKTAAEGVLSKTHIINPVDAELLKENSKAWKTSTELAAQRRAEMIAKEKEEHARWLANHHSTKAQEQEEARKQLERQWAAAQHDRALARAEEDKQRNARIAAVKLHKQHMKEAAEARKRILVRQIVDLEDDTSTDGYRYWMRDPTHALIPRPAKQPEDKATAMKKKNKKVNKPPSTRKKPQSARKHHAASRSARSQRRVAARTQRGNKRGGSDGPRSFPRRLRTETDHGMGRRKPGKRLRKKHSEPDDSGDDYEEDVKKLLAEDARLAALHAAEGQEHGEESEEPTVGDVALDAPVVADVDQNDLYAQNDEKTADRDRDGFAAPNMVIETAPDAKQFESRQEYVDALYQEADEWFGGLYTQTEVAAPALT